MELGKRIRTLREKRGIEQLELASRVDISQSKMNKIETGFQKRIEPELISSIAKELNVRVGYLLNEEESDEERKQVIINKIVTEFPDANLMFNDLANMSANDMQEVYDFIKFKKSQKKGD